MEPNIDTANLIKGIIGSLVRFALAGTVGYLVNKGLITEDQGAALVPAVILGVITLVWAVWRKYQIQKRIAVALGLRAGATPEDLDSAVSERR